MTAIGEIIRASRIKNKLNIEESAFRLDVSAKQLQRYERGEAKVNKDVLVRMSGVYNEPALNIANNPAAISYTLDELDYEIGILRRKIFKDGWISLDEIEDFERLKKLEATADVYSQMLEIHGNAQKKANLREQVGTATAIAY